MDKDSAQQLYELQAKVNRLTEIIMTSASGLEKTQWVTATPLAGFSRVTGMITAFDIDHLWLRPDGKKVSVAVAYTDVEVHYNILGARLYGPADRHQLQPLTPEEVASLP